MSSAAASQAGTTEVVGAATGREREALANAVRDGLRARPYSLPAWLFYDERGSALFEQITDLPEYYLTRTERALFERHAEEMLACAAGPEGRRLTFLELGAGTATKTGVLLRAAVQRQGEVLYAPLDVSPTALEEAERTLMASLPGLSVSPQVVNYMTTRVEVSRPSGCAVLALYIGSSIGNFDPAEARELLRHLRSQLEVGDALLLGTDLAPAGAHEIGAAAVLDGAGRGGNGNGRRGKTVANLLAAYDDAAGVTAAFNRNVLHRLNRDLRADFDMAAFRHEARWNAAESRIEMHLVAERAMRVLIPAVESGFAVVFEAGESIHTENSYKYDRGSIAAMLEAGGFAVERTWTDAAEMFAVTVARVV